MMAPRMKPMSKMAPKSWGSEKVRVPTVFRTKISVPKNAMAMITK